MHCATTWYSDSVRQRDEGEEHAMSPPRPRNVLVWHVHGSWLDAFVAGSHHYLIPATGDERGQGLRGRNWPNAREVTPRQLADEPVDLVVLQRPAELALAEQ